MEQQNLEQQPIIIAMKGHPGTGKSTLAHSIASSLKCPLIDKDHVRDCTRSLQQTLLLFSSPPATALNLLNDLSYEILFQMGSTQLGLGLSVVIDSPLSRRTHLDRLEQLATASGARIVIVECKPNDVSEWRRRLERRGEADGASWHKPATWPELERLVEGYGGCTEYDVGEVPKVVVDTTAAVGVEEQVAFVLEFIASSGGGGGRRGSFCPN